MLNFLAAVLGILAAMVYVIIRMIWLLPGFALSMAFGRKEPDEPTTPDGFFWRAMSLLYDDPVSAISDFDAAISLRRMNHIAYNFRGLAHHINGDYDSAISDFHTAIEYSPTYAHPFVLRAHVYADLGDFARSIADFETAVHLGHDYLERDLRHIAGAYNGRGLAYFENEAYDLAIADLEKAIELDPSDPDVFTNRGRSLEAKGELSLAARDFESAHRLEDPEMYDYSGPDEIGEDEYEERERENRSMVRSDRAMEHYANGNYDLAIAWMDLAVSMDPLDETGYHNRGLVYLGAGSYMEAMADFNTSIGLSDSGFGAPPHTW